MLGRFRAVGGRGIGELGELTDSLHRDVLGIGVVELTVVHVPSLLVSEDSTGELEFSGLGGTVVHVGESVIDISGQALRIVTPVKDQGGVEVIVGHGSTPLEGVG